MKKILTFLSRRLHILFWRLTGKLEHYIDVQIKSSHNTRENKVVQENIKFALNKFFPLLEDKNSKILDAGCGDGWTMDQMLEKGYNDLWGIDISEEKLAVAEKYKHKNVKVMLLPDVDFPDNNFDAIFCRHVYEHLLFPEKTLATFYRILKKGGLLFLIAPKSEITSESNESHILKINSPNDIAVLMKNVGFENINTEEHLLEELEFWLIVKK